MFSNFKIKKVILPETNILYVTNLDINPSIHLCSISSHSMYRRRQLYTVTLTSRHSITRLKHNTLTLKTVNGSCGPGRHPHKHCNMQSHFAQKGSSQQVQTFSNFLVLTTVPLTHHADNKFSPVKKKKPDGSLCFCKPLTP